MKTIVFSRDRALQLEAFLRSYRDQVHPTDPVDVLYLASSARHAEAYRQLFAEYRPLAVPHPQGPSFKADLVDLLSDASTVICFVDDQLFLRRWQVLEQPGLSLRLGLNLTYDYNSYEERMPLPTFQPYHPELLLAWQWGEGVASWGYPLSLDGHVFDGVEFRRLVEAIEFHSPNTLESGLQIFRPNFAARTGFCYATSKVVNVPWNQVQTDWSNRHGVGNDPDTLLTCWEAGQRLAVEQFYGYVNRSVHEELPLVLKALA